MSGLTKFACALLFTGGLAAPALAAGDDADSTRPKITNDAGSGPTPGATPMKEADSPRPKITNDAGSGPTNGAAPMNKTGGDQN